MFRFKYQSCAKNTSISVLLHTCLNVIFITPTDLYLLACMLTRVHYMSRESAVLDIGWCPLCLELQWIKVIMALAKAWEHQVTGASLAAARTSRLNA